MIFLEVDGISYEGFTEVSVTRSVASLSGSFSFRATSKPENPLPFKIGQSCRVLIDDNPVINGFIESVNVSYGGNEHEISIAGRDKTMDVIDCSTLLKEISGTVSIESVIKKILQANGLTDIEVINNVPGLKNFGAGDVESAEIGETRFEFMDRYARKRQVLLTGDGNGNIVITRSGLISAQTALVRLTGGENNILSANVNYSETNLFNKYIVRSQLNPVALEGGEVTAGEVASQSGEAIDSDVRNTRVTEIRPEQSGSDDDSKQRALWNKNISRAKSFNYTATVQGFYQDVSETRLWIPNEIVPVRDDFAGMTSTVDAKLLINSVTYNFSNDSGSTTTLTCIDKDSYTLEAEKDLRESRVNDLGI
jgi:prophage tail gpP-like protein